MSDVGDVFRETRRRRSANRAAILNAVDTSEWTRHTEWHFSREFNDGRVDWWPGAGKARFNNQMYYGHRKVTELIKMLESGDGRG